MLDLLKGVRIVDLSTVVLGPYATQLLADMGAEVIKVEPPEGDVFRGARPGRPGGDGAGFLNCNRNKRSIALDLSTPDDMSVFHRLVESADVMVHNLRPASARKLGIDYAAMSALNRTLVYCAARGYGEGPYGDEPAYDDCIQAAAGMAWLNADENGEPRFVRTILCDKVAGLHLAFAIASAIASRASTGKGCHIETPMFEAMASFLLVEQLSGQTFVPSLPDRGYARLNAEGRRPYRSADGYVAIMPYTGAHWRRFLRLIGEDKLAAAGWLADSEARSSRIEMLYDIILKVAPSRTTADWLSTLRSLDIPCAAVNRLEDLPTEPHMVESGYFRSMTHPKEGELLYAGSPFRSDTAEHTPDQPAPVLDADRAAILAELDVYSRAGSGRE